MAISKVEAVTYGAGLLSILAGIVYRKRNPEASTQALIFGTGTLLTGGAMSIQRARTQRRLSSMSGGRALGLNEKGTFKAGGQALSVWDDKEMGVQERVLLLQKQVKASVQDPTMRNLALAITGRATRDVRLDNEVLTVRGAGCADRDNLCELNAIYNWMKSNIRYTGDIGTHVQAPGKKDERNEPIDTFQSAARTVEYRGGDCLPAGTLLLVEGHRLVPIENVVPGSKIWGLDRWSDVQNVWYKGELPIDAIQLNNGSWIKATGDHKVYVALCGQHTGECSCAVEMRNVQRIHVSELLPGMVLLRPVHVAAGAWSRKAGAPDDLLRVKAIERGVAVVPVYDISTDDHYVYLPEADVTVSNCDDHATLAATLAINNGFAAKFRITSNTGETWDHIYTLAGTPAHDPDPKKWVVLDTTLSGNQFNKQPARKKQIDFAA